jgi:glycosyltransferase involved in cell wall biosynthesis
MKKRILINCLVLEGSRSGYRRIIKNILDYSSSNNNLLVDSYRLVFVFQKSGYQSLELQQINKYDEDLKIILLQDFGTTWKRGLAEQLIVPFLALKYKCDFIFMPATFGLFLPIRKTFTFIHTNTSFSVEKQLRGRSVIEQFIHNILVRITAATSHKLFFTTKQTHREYELFLRKRYPDYILGNGIKITTCDNPSSSIFLDFEPYTYLLSVSQFYRLKNFDRLIDAFILAKDSNKIGNLKLVIVGTVKERDFYFELKKKSICRNDILLLHDISDDHLNILFSNCLAYCFYSLFEGFSLTPAEAIMHNKFVALSEIPTHTEIYGSNPIYANPNSIQSISTSIVTLVNKSLSGVPDYDSTFIDKFCFDAFVERLLNWID